MVKILVQHGSSVNLPSPRGLTPLYMAAHEDNEEMVRFLLASGADKNLATEGLTPLDVALQQGNDKVSKIFLSIV